MNFRDKKIVIGMIMIVFFLCLLGLSFTKACAASKPTKQNKASIEDNLKEFVELFYKEGGDTEPFLSSLDKESRLQLARRMLKESDGKIVYVGANILILNGQADEATPALANLITSGRADTDLKGRLGYDWVHNPDAYPWSTIYTGIARYMIKNWQNYTDSERLWAYRYLSDLLQLDSHGTFSADVAERALKKFESEAPESK
jgi:hypothetical protein